MRFIASLLISLTVFSFTASAQVPAAQKKYETSGKALMSMINSGKVDASQAEKLVKEMVAEGKVMAEAYGKKEASAGELMAFVVANIGKMEAATFDDLQKNWHDGGAFIEKEVGLNVKKEENEKHLDPVHVIVHPMMTLRAIKDGNLQAAKEELAEGLEQAQATAETLK